MKALWCGLLLGLLASPAYAAEEPLPVNEDEDSCLNDAVCYGVGAHLPKPLEEHRAGMRVVMGLFPLGALYVPRWFLDEEMRPELKGGLRRSTYLHAFGPCVGLACIPPGGCCTGPAGSVIGTVLGPIILAIVGGIAGFIVIPIGGTILGFCAGGIGGLLVGFFGGGVLGVLLGPLALCTCASIPLSIWQLYVGPASVMHAWRKAYDLMPPKSAVPLTDRRAPLPETPTEKAPPPPQQTPPPPPQVPDEGMTVK